MRQEFQNGSIAIVKQGGKAEAVSNTGNGNINHIAATAKFCYYKSNTYKGVAKE